MKFPEAKMPCRDLNQLYPRVKELALKLIAECQKQGLPITITQTYRSAAYQQDLYNQGRSTKGKIVTNCKPGQSPHEYHVAFDFCMSVPNHTYDAEMMRKVGAIGVKLGLEWGGNFHSFVDIPHFQYYGGLTLKEIKLGKEVK